LSDNDIFWKVIIHLVFIASAVFLALLDRITSQTHTTKHGHKDTD